VLEPARTNSASSILAIASGGPPAVLLLALS
jgi:hypothetical protein